MSVPEVWLIESFILMVSMCQQKGAYEGVAFGPRLSMISWRMRSWASVYTARHRVAHLKVVMVVSPPAMNKSDTKNSSWFSAIDSNSNWWFEDDLHNLCKWPLYRTFDCWAARRWWWFCLWSAPDSGRSWTRDRRPCWTCGRRSASWSRSNVPWTRPAVWPDCDAAIEPTWNGVRFYQWISLTWNFVSSLREDQDVIVCTD